MAYIYEDGEPTDFRLTFDIKNYTEVKRSDDQHVDVDIIIENRDFTYKTTASIDDFELEDLARTFLRFRNGEIKEFYEWDHIEGDVNFLFVPSMNEVYLKVFYGYPGTHMSGFFIDLYDEDEYMRFYDYLRSVISQCE